MHFENFFSLQSLKLQNNKITKITCNEGSLSQLTYLDCNNTNLNKDDIMDILSKLPNLDSLTISSIILRILKGINEENAELEEMVQKLYLESGEEEELEKENEEVETTEDMLKVAIKGVEIMKFKKEVLKKELEETKARLKWFKDGIEFNYLEKKGESESENENKNLKIENEKLKKIVEELQAQLEQKEQTNQIEVNLPKK
ncbi:MAG: hypothetical protein MRERC_11c043 [Mycoplasmataceae bacterium RC_NB112A]|nr:MAG: hypothetical protein MRERC_11c043 [Mycoplasmataceae bacterium RC_NB112A]